MSGEHKAWAIIVPVLAVAVLIAALYGIRTAHETKLKRLEIVKVCIAQDDREPETCRRLGSA